MQGRSQGLRSVGGKTGMRRQYLKMPHNKDYCKFTAEMKIEVENQPKLQVVRTKNFKILLNS